MGTTFTIQVESWGEFADVELKQGGSEIYVTKENREEYVELYIEYIFNKQCERQIKAFQKGFYRVCNEDVIMNMFKPEELELLVCGSKKLDFHAW